MDITYLAESIKLTGYNTGTLVDTVRSPHLSNFWI